MSATALPARRRRHSPYPLWFYLPAGILFLVLFAVPTFASFYFSLTRWTLTDTEFIGLDNFRQFFNEPFLIRGFINTFIYGFVTSGAKVVLGLLLGLLLTSPSWPGATSARWCSSRCWCRPSASASPSRS